MQPANKGSNRVGAEMISGFGALPVATARRSGSGLFLDRNCDLPFMQ